MITRYGMSDEFDMVAMETVENQYLGGDASLTCSPETQQEIDRKVVVLIKQQHKKAKALKAAPSAAANRIGAGIFPVIQKTQLRSL